MKVRYHWLLAGTVTYLGPLVFMWQHFEKQQRTAPFTRPSFANVLDYGAEGNDFSDDSSAFQAAFDDAVKENLAVYIPKKTYVIAKSLSIPSGLVIRSDGAELKQAGGNQPLLSAQNVDNWVINGPMTLTGNRSDNNKTGNGKGLWIGGGNHYIVDKLTVQNFTGKGIQIESGERNGLERGNHGQFAFVTFINNSIGLQIGADGNAPINTGAEYNLFTLLSFSSNDTAVVTSTGNNVISTTNIVDNKNGIQLMSGSNNGHGIFNATNINHNVGFNIQSDAVDNGYTFNGCHIYGDSAKDGIVHLTHSKGIHITGGTLDAAVINDVDGTNMISDMFITGDSYSVSGTASQSVRTQNLFIVDQDKAKP